MQEKVAKPQRMVRKQILITPEQNRRLKARAASSGVTETEIVRLGVELALDLPADQEPDWRHQLRQALAGVALDEGFAHRVRENKRAQAESWRQRLEVTRRRLAGD